MSHAPRPPGPARVHPLAGRRIAVTRAREQAGDLVRELEALGADVVAAPTIRIVRLTDLAALRAALTRVPPYDWIVFTSQNAVQVVCDRLPGGGPSSRDGRPPSGSRSRSEEQTPELPSPSKLLC